MDKLLKPGRYIVAVSGGIDSVALLHMLTQNKNLELVVAHFDHGIRPDSAEDTEFVAGLAREHNLPFVTERVELGDGASEALARQKRYNFLQKSRKKNMANAVVTAHHQDDVIETALLNVLRGTKRLGLVSLKSTDVIIRPLLHMTKEEIKSYANKHNLKWREDPTNQETYYKRSRIRQIIKKSLTVENRQSILNLLKTIEKQNKEIQAITNTYLANQSDTILDKKSLTALPDELANEIAAAWLRKNKINFDKTTIERIVKGAKNLQNGSQIDVKQNHYCLLTKDQIVLKRR